MQAQLANLAVERRVEVIPPGLVQKEARQEIDYNRNVIIKTADGKSIALHRFIDKEKAFIEMDATKKRNKKFMQFIRRN